MLTKVRMPGSRATDPRLAVTLEETGTPWPMVFYFLRLEDDETAESELVNVGFEIGERFDRSREEVEAGAATLLGEDPRAIDPVCLQRVAANYGLYANVARNALVLEESGVEGAVAMLRARGRTRRGLTDDFYRLIAGEYQVRKQAGGSPAAAIARAHHVDRSTASRWISGARRRGLIDEEGR